MAGISSAGLGSGLDVNGLVSQLVAAERAPLQARITRQEVKTTTTLSAMGTMKGALSGFQSALNALKDAASFTSYKATAASTDYFSLSADSGAASGHYDIEVVRVAKGHQLSSAPVASAATAIGDGVLTLQLGQTSFNVTIAPTANTLDDIRNAINDASDNPGITATLVNGTLGTQLVLSSTKLGTDSAIKVTTSGGNGGLNALVYDPQGTMNLTQMQPAQTAQIRVSGILAESSSNVFADAIEGVTITLKKPTAVGETIGMDVAFDASAVTTKVQNFVTEYNKMQAALAKLGAYDPDTKSAGPLLGDALLRSVQTQMRRGLTDAVTTAATSYSSLVNLGIKTTASGTLELDNAKLQAALTADPTAVSKLFVSSDGIAARMYNSLEGILDTKGDIQTRTDSLNKTIKDINTQKTRLDERMADVEARYRKQFMALDSLLSSMQSTSSYLSQQLANLPKAGG